jgi:ankyrin repeat protein
MASRGKSVTARQSDVQYQTPLLSAISNGDTERVKTLIADEVNFPGENVPDNRPLQEAALHGHENIVKLLLDTGKLDVNARDSRERTAVFAAVSRGRDSIVKLLRSNGAKQLSAEESRIANQEQMLWRAYEAQIGLHKRSPLRHSQTVEGADVTSEPDSDEDVLSIRIPTSSGSSDGDHIYKLEVGSYENIKEIEETANQRRQVAQERGEWVKGPLKTPQM